MLCSNAFFFTSFSAVCYLWSFVSPYRYWIKLHEGNLTWKLSEPQPLLISYKIGTCFCRCPIFFLNIWVFDLALYHSSRFPTLMMMRLPYIAAVLEMVQPPFNVFIGLNIFELLAHCGDFIVIFQVILFGLWCQCAYNVMNYGWCCHLKNYL